MAQQETPNQFWNEVVGNKGTASHCLASERGVRVSGEGRLLGGPCCLSSGIRHLPLPSAWGCGESLSVAPGFSCSDLLLSPSSASSPEFPSSQSPGWFVSAHLGVWDTSRAWFQDSERTQEDLPLRLFGLGALGMLRCRETPTPGLGKPPSNSDGAAVGGWTTTSSPGSPVLTTSSGRRLFLGFPQPCCVSELRSRAGLPGGPEGTQESLPSLE